MKNMSGLMSCALALCVSGSLMADSNEAMTTQKTITGPAAYSFMQALQASGVTDTDNKVGQVNLRVQEVTCSQAVVWHPISKCSLMFNSTVLVPNVDNSKVMFGMLNANGGRVRVGMGVRKVVGKDFHCISVPDLQPMCTFFVKKGLPS